MLVLRHYEHLFLFSMLILRVTSSRFCLYLLNNHHLTYIFSHVHTEAYTHKHTCIISTQEEWRQLCTGAWLRRAEGRLLLKTKAKNQGKKGHICQKTNDIHESEKKTFEHIEFQAKLL